MGESFDEVILIEHFQSFYRFNIKANGGISNIFGSLEENVNLNFFVNDIIISLEKCT